MNKKIIGIFMIGIVITSGIEANTYSTITTKNNFTYDMIIITPYEFSSQIQP